MIKSMTAYGRAKSSSREARWVVELHSVNRKMLDINVNLPREFLRFDLEVRKWLSEKIQRGQITVRISLEQEDLIEESLRGSLETLKPLKSAWEKIAKGLGYDPKKEIDLQFLCSRMPSASSVNLGKNEEAVKKALQATINKALKELLEMKEREGQNLAKDVKMRISLIETAAQKIAKFAPKATENFRKKLFERIQEVAKKLDKETEDRILKEVALFAERCDITEELTRLASHIEQFRHYLATDDKTVGRTLDFLTQELNREINTIASKSQEGEIAHLTVTMKSELEKIREQLQNIE